VLLYTGYISYSFLSPSILTTSLCYLLTPAFHSTKKDLCINDLELPAFGEMAILQDVKKELIATGEYESVFMSGSGSTMVCLGNHLIQEDTNFERESKDDWLAVLTQPINREDRSKWYEPSFLTDIADLGEIEEEYLIKGADLECDEDHDDDE
jgi:hypothetical protein